MIDQIIQIIIFVLGSITIFLLAQKNKWQRWGYIIGLFQEIFWFYATFKARQWGIFALTFIYSVCFVLGIWNYWIRKDKK